ARRLRAAGHRLGAGQPRPGRDVGAAQHLLPLDRWFAPPALDRGLLHAPPPRRRPGDRPPLAGAGPALLHLAGRRVYRRPRRPGPAPPPALCAVPAPPARPLPPP